MKVLCVSDGTLPFILLILFFLWSNPDSVVCLGLGCYLLRRDLQHKLLPYLPRQYP
jgi:hypothetical protein